MARCAAGGIILSSVTIKYQLGFVFHAGSVIAPPRAVTPHGTWESAMNAAFSVSTSAAKEAGKIVLSRDKKPCCGGRGSGTGGARGGGLVSGSTDSPPSGAQAGVINN